jgi:hypothetical protein
MILLSRVSGRSVSFSENVDLRYGMQGQWSLMVDFENIIEILEIVVILSEISSSKILNYCSEVVVMTM